MPEPSTALPDGDVLAVDERTTLEGFLAFQRAILARKAEGLTEQEARRRPCPPSDLSMIGLIRHMADVERIWATRQFLGADHQPIHYGPAHPDGDVDGDFHPPPDASVADALDTYWREIEAADRAYATHSLDRVEQGRDQVHSLRWILVHLIEEYARHCGHADLIRQAIDGSTGD